MTGSIEGRDSTPARAVLQNAIAFRENSLGLVMDAIAQVKLLTAAGAPVYSPLFPTWRDTEPEGGLKTNPGSSISGRLSPAEAVASLVLREESSAMAQAFWRSPEAIAKLHDLIGIPSEGWPTDVFTGIAEVGMHVGAAAQARDVLLSEQDPKTIVDLGIKDAYEWYAEPVTNDGMVIGRHTVNAIIQVMVKQAEDIIPVVPEGAETDKEIQDRITSRKRGILLGAKLYCEAVEYASQHVSRGLARTSE